MDGDARGAAAAVEPPTLPALHLHLQLQDASPTDGDGGGGGDGGGSSSGGDKGVPRSLASSASAAVAACGGPLVAFCVCFSFLHWFKPSGPYLVNYVAAHGGIPNAVTYDVVYPWSTYTLLPCTIAAGAVFEVAGPAASLLTAAVADVLSVALVIPATAANLAPFIASQFAFAASFTSLFLVTATLTAALPPAAYQRATSYNRAATLAASMLSAAAGQAMQSAGELSGTITASLAFSLASLAFLVGYMVVGCVPRWRRVCGRLPRKSDGGSSNSGADAAGGAVAAGGGMCMRGWQRTRTLGGLLARVLRQVARDSRAAVLAVTQAVLFATHTLALTYWQNLFEAVSPGEGYNGAILATAYALSVVAAWLPSLPRVDAALHAAGVAGICAAAAAAAALLGGMAFAPSLLPAAACFVAYHALVELTLVVLAAQLGRRVAALMAVPPRDTAARCADALSPPPDAYTSLLADRAGLEAGESSGKAAASESTGSAAAAASVNPRFGALYAAVQLVAQGVQIALQSPVGPTGADLSLPHRYLTFAVVIMAMVVVLVVGVAASRCCWRTRPPAGARGAIALP